MNEKCCVRSVPTLGKSLLSSLNIHSFLQKMFSPCLYLARYAPSPMGVHHIESMVPTLIYGSEQSLFHLPLPIAERAGGHGHTSTNDTPVPGQRLSHLTWYSAMHVFVCLYACGTMLLGPRVSDMRQGWSHAFLLQVWSRDQHHQYLLGACCKCSILGPSRPPESESAASQGPQGIPVHSEVRKVLP